MSGIYLYDDAVARDFEPFSLTRPVSELRAGAELIRTRWEKRLHLAARGFLGAPHLADFDEPGATHAVCDDSDLEPGSVVANSRCVVALTSSAADMGARAWSCNGRLAAVRVGTGVAASLFADGSLTLEELAARETKSHKASGENTRGQALTPHSGAGVVELEGRWLEAPWDLLASLSDQLAADIPVIASDLTIHNPSGITTIGDHAIYCERGAQLEPFVVLDASNGPILIRHGVRVSAFSRLAGPLYVGEDSLIVGDSVGSSSIGEVCKVHGEMSGSIILGHSNKGHAGFVGDSYLGRWVNLGAGTITSNLKNTYGRVRVAGRSGARDTGLQFLGTLFGDHSKTAIGTMLTTGTIVGAGANVFGRAPGKRVEPFAWGCDEPDKRYAVAKFLEVAGRVMARRHVTMSERARRAIEAAYRAAASAS